MTGTARAALLVLLLAAAAGAAWVAWDLQRRAGDLRTHERDVAVILDRSLDAVHELTAAQRAYVAPAQPLRPWLDRVSMLVQQLYRDTAALGGLARAPDTLQAVERLEDALSAFVQVDTQVRERLRVGDLRAASDVIFDDAAVHAGAAVQQLRTIRAAEAAAFQAAHVTVFRDTGAAGGIALILAALGILLSRVPARVPSALAHTASAPAQATTAAAAAPIDLTALGDVCASLSRLTSPEELPGLLARAAAALGASGLIVWLDTGGRLSAVAAHGYDPLIIARMGPIERTATHATADAWRSGTLRTVAADGSPRGAIVAPMFRPDGCIGALAAEVPPGAEAEPARGAATSVLAAQLAVMLAGREDT